MPRPQVVVSVAAAPPRRGIDSDTGRTFLIWPGTTGPQNPVRCRAATEATDAGIPQPYAQYVADALAEGSPEVIAVRADIAALDAAGAQVSVWANALAKADVATYGIGQVIIPGVASQNAHDALLAHADATNRCVLLDGDVDSTVAELTAFAAAQEAKPGAVRAGLIAGWVSAVGTAGVDRQIPGSVIVAGLVGRRDGLLGHAGGVPAGSQNGAGISRLATNVSLTFTDAQQDVLADNGINPLVRRPGQVLLGNWRSLSADSRWTQLQFGRLAMQIGNGAAGVLDEFLFRTIDARGQLANEIEAAVVSLLAQLEASDALYGTNGSSYRVVVSDSPADAAAGLVRVSIEAAFSKYAERLVFDVVVQQPGALTEEVA
ncbi:hypothetical protein [Kineococcus terrestris]|uniref:hypothetical protein n=1 Tax=Kineococcus terrestris TaxID=2044856 RepID=UPI0034DADAED